MVLPYGLSWTDLALAGRGRRGEDERRDARRRGEWLRPAPRLGHGGAVGERSVDQSAPFRLHPLGRFQPSPRTGSCPIVALRRARRGVAAMRLAVREATLSAPARPADRSAPGARPWCRRLSHGPFSSACCREAPPRSPRARGAKALRGGSHRSSRRRGGWRRALRVLRSSWGAATDGRRDNSCFRS
jgi:hypothetical protein